MKTLHNYLKREAALKAKKNQRSNFQLPQIDPNDPWYANQTDALGNLLTTADLYGANEVQCQTCQDKGIITLTRDPHHPDHGRAFPCPNPRCLTAQRNRLNKLNVMIDDRDLMAGYSQFSFETWDTQAFSLRAQKFTARYAVEMYVRKQGRPFAMCEVADIIPDETLADKFYKKYRNSREKKNGFVLAGTNGTSKTGLLAAAASMLLADGQPVLFINALDMLDKVFDNYGQPEGEGEKLETVKTIDHLFVDEMTFESTATQRRNMQKIFRSRHDRRAEGLPMAFTTNLLRDDFEKWFGPQTATGILGKCHWIEMGGAVIRHEVDEAMLDEEIL